LAADAVIFAEETFAINKVQLALGAKAPIINVSSLISVLRMRSYCGGDTDLLACRQQGQNRAWRIYSVSQ
jgi:hypothetical protein